MKNLTWISLCKEGELLVFLPSKFPPCVSGSFLLALYSRYCQRMYQNDCDHVVFLSCCFESKLLWTSKDDKTTFRQVKNKGISGEPFWHWSQVIIDMLFKVTEVFGWVINLSIVGVQNNNILPSWQSGRSFIWIKKSCGPRKGYPKGDFSSYRLIISDWCDFWPVCEMRSKPWEVEYSFVSEVGNDQPWCLAQIIPGKQRL